MSHSSLCPVQDPRTSSSRDAGLARDAELARWYALNTLPRNEKSVAKHLEMLGYEAFLPTYQVTRTWKNRQRMTSHLPLFVGYVFTRLALEDRFRALGVMGALRFVGTSQGPAPIPSSEIEFVRSKYCSENFAPYLDLVIGTRVRIWRGVMRGVEGVLVRKDGLTRFILRIDSINQHIAAVVDSADLELV